MAYRIGVDIGGTFTDFALLDDAGAVSIHKQLTTPDDPSRAVLDGVEFLLSQAGAKMGEVSVINHGTTLVTNALIERKGARVGMLVTSGMEDVLDIGRERRYDEYDLRAKFAAPLVPRRMRRPIAERMHYSGRSSVSPDLETARDAVRDLVETHNIQSIAVCFLHAHVSAVHEHKVVGMIREEFPDLYVSCSADVLPAIREYQRWTTTTINAYVQPVLDRYITRLDQELRARGFEGLFYMMTSSGGTVALETARTLPVRLLESGPAAGALMAAFHGRHHKAPNVLSFDMGGTTAKGALVRNGRPMKKYELEVAHAYKAKPGSGFPVKVPTIDMIEIGSGGGSIAEVDQRGLIRVGPRSAGAAPGPACYGLGGTDPTLTDANLVLGYLDPEFFLGGRMTLDAAAARKAIAGRIGEPLGLATTRAAWGIHDVVNEDVARAFRIHAAERGFDYRISSMVAFGGSGPMHAARIARKLRVPEIILPFGAGVASAHGLLISPLAFETMRSKRTALADLDTRTFEAEFAPLVEQATALVRQSGPAAERIEVLRKLDMRYEGQGYDIDVEVPAGGDLASVKAAFEKAYNEIFSSFLLDEPIEIVNWKVEVSCAVFPEDGAFGRYSPVTSDPVKCQRQVYFPETDGYVACKIYDRYALRPGITHDGPALIEEAESTSIVGVGDRFEVLPDGSIVIRVNTGETA